MRDNYCVYVRWATGRIDVFTDYTIRGAYEEASRRKGEADVESVAVFKEIEWIKQPD